MTIEVGKCYRTPWEPSGVVRVLNVEPSHTIYKEVALIEFVGDHPKGYKSGTHGRYPSSELDGREVPDPRISGEQS